MPKLSVIIPVYNTSKFLDKCLNSVLTQNFSDMEIICVDDGSTDDSYDKLLNYKDQIIIYRKQNGGLSSARNYALDRAKGDYVLFVDSDDYLLPGAINRLMKHTDVADTVIGFPKVEYLDTRTTEAFDKDYFAPRFTGKVWLTDHMLQNIPVVAWAKIFNRHKIEQRNLRFPEGLLYEDNFFFWAYFFFEKIVYIEAEPVYCYVRHRTSIMSRSTEKREGYSINRIYIFQKLCQFYEENNIVAAASNNIIFLGEQLFWGAFYDAPDFEKAKIIWEMSKTLRHYDINTSSSELLERIKNGTIHFGLLPDKRSVSRHWIVKLMMPFCPIGSKRRFLASFLYQNLRKSYYFFKNGNKQQTSEFKLDPILVQMEQQSKALEHLRKQYIEPYLKTVSNGDCSPKEHGEKIVWQYWDKGITQAPKIVQACVHSVSENLPKGYKHIVLDDRTVSQFVQIPDFITKKMTSSPSFSKTFYSDILRLFLLSKYGGIWIDATVLLTSQIPENLLQSDFFCFYRGEEPKNVDRFEKFNPMYFSWRKDFLVRMCNSFIIAKPRHPFTEALKSILLQYWEFEPKFSYYFTFQIIFEYLINDKKFESLNWSHCDDLKFHDLLLICRNAFQKNEWDKICGRIFAHKLTYYSDVDDMSYYKLIENGELK